MSVRTIRTILCGLLSAVAITESTSTQTQWPTERWATSSPAAEGFSPERLAGFDAEIAAGKYGFIDNMLVIRHGQIVYDRTYSHDYDKIYGREAAARGPLNAHDPTGPYNYFNPWWHPFYQRGDLHSMQSVTKTVTSVVIGVATARKEFPALETPVMKFFDAATVKNLDARKRKITIRHLLTMTAGMEWNEDLPYADPNNTCVLMEASYDWIRFTIDRPMAHEPGTTFQYNSGATQLLSYIFRAATGTDIEEYAVRHLFAPLGIQRYFWKRSPSGLVDTEGGLYLRAHDAAKIAYLFLKNGVWNGQAIVQPEWVQASLAPSIAVADGVKYGFKWWLYPYGNEGRMAWGGSGLGGQRPIAIPEYDVIVVFTGWNLLPGKPSLSPRVAIDRIVDALEKR